MFAQPKKCLVLDLDNTLWGGIVGEDGIKGIQLGFTPPGSSYLAFQQALLDLHNRGIILAVNSKNNHDDAMEVISNHPHMVLRENHFAAWRINWNNKAENIREIAKELNIGTDSMVFLDDDPMNRLLVRAELPEVAVPDLPLQPEQYAAFLLEMPYFAKGGTITDEDKMRGNFYVTERMRVEAEESASSRSDFLKDLGVVATIFENDKSSATRLAQMTGRTNQFNVLKKEYTTAEIEAFCDSGAHMVFSVAARDRFGDYGIIGLAVADTRAMPWRIESFLMSCRALGRGIEDAFFLHMAAHAKEKGSVGIAVRFKKSEKNAPAELFLKRVCRRWVDGYYTYDPSRPITEPAWVAVSLHTRV